MAISSYGVRLCYMTAGNYGGKFEGHYIPIVDIKDFPDLGGSPEMLETTTLSNKMDTYIPGIQKLDALEFTCNYDKSDYDRLKTYEGQQKTYVLLFGGTKKAGGYYLDGDDNDGAFKIFGELSVHPVGAGVNEVVNMKVTIAPAQEITAI